MAQRVAGRALAALGILLLATVIAILAMPAGVAAWGVTRISDGAIVLADADGMLHSGRGRVTDTAGHWSVAVAWDIDCAKLWRGVLSIRFGATPADAIRGTLDVSRAEVIARNVDATVPAAIAQAWLPPSVALRVGGEIAIVSTEWVLRRQDARGRATARWSPARIADSRANVIDFGVLSADIDASGEGIAAKLANAGGDTLIAGDIRIRDVSIDADVTVTPRSSAPSPLLAMIAPFGATAAGGGTRFSYHGPWQVAPR